MGHHFFYADKVFQILEQKSALTNWTYIGPENSFIDKYKLNKFYIPNARQFATRNSILQKIKLICNSINIGLFIRKKVSKLDKVNILIEDYSVYEFFAIFLIGFLGKQKIKFKIVHRYYYKYLSPHLTLTRIFFYLLKKINFNIKHFTDSDLLTDFWSVKLNEEVGTIPICTSCPHINFNYQIKKYKNPVLYFPGTLRDEKGKIFFDNLIEIESSKDKKNFTIMSSKNSFIKHQTNNISFIALDNFLDDENYYITFNDADFVVLNYDPSRYKFSTSSIFIESILMGCIPIASRSSWMYYELCKFSLDKLCIDYEFNETQLGFFRDEMPTEIIENLNRMQEKYKEFHSSDNFYNTVLR